MRICGFVVNTGCQIIVLDRNVDIEKSDWGFRDFPCEFEGRMERVDKYPEGPGDEVVENLSDSKQLHDRLILFLNHFF